MQLKNFILENKIINFFSIFFVFLHFYSWDLQNIINASEKIDIKIGFLRYLLLFCLIKLLVLNKNMLDRNIFFLLIIFILQSVINFFIYDQVLNLREIGSIIFFLLLYIVVKIEKDQIFKYLKSFFEVYILLIFFGFLFFLFFDKLNIGSACNLVLVDSIIFHENSHYAMMSTCIFIFYLYSEKNMRNILFFFIYLGMSFIYLSLTFIIGMIFSLVICLIVNFIHKKNNNLLIFVLIFIFTSVLFYKSDCTNRVKYLVDKTKIDISLYDNKEDVSLSDNEEYEKMINDYEDLLPTRNLSSQVYNIAILNTVYTLKNKIFGWGFNSYQRVFDANIINIMQKYYKIEYEQNMIKQNNFELISVNTNDARSVLLKIVNEFGVFCIFFLLAGVKFLLNTNINITLKLTIASLLITQLISGAGYFNGGFAVFLFLMLITNRQITKI